MKALVPLGSGPLYDILGYATHDTRENARLHSQRSLAVFEFDVV